jgi:hypothetical protein
MTISPELYSEIKARAEEMNIGIDRAVATLLRLGLESQKAREHEIERLVEQARQTEDPQLREEIGDRLGSTIFR